MLSARKNTQSLKQIHDSSSFPLNNAVSRSIFMRRDGSEAVVHNGCSRHRLCRLGVLESSTRQEHQHSFRVLNCRGQKSMHFTSLPVKKAAFWPFGNYTCYFATMNCYIVIRFLVKQVVIIKYIH